MSTHCEKQKVVIWGASGHAMVVADILRLTGSYEVVGFLDDRNIERNNTEFCGTPVVGGRQQLVGLRKSGVELLTFGFGDCATRLSLSVYVRAKGFALASAIHPGATIAGDARIGAGTVIAAGAVINPGSIIGENVIINTCASVDHECLIEEGCHISPGAHLGGGVTVGRGAWVGIGANVKDHVRIGAGSVIGAGAAVVCDIPENVVAYGVPAKVMKRISRLEQNMAVG